MKYLIFDSGPIINFAMNGLLPLLIKLKKEFKGDFLITKEVKEEIIDRPLTIKRFELEALQIKALYNKGVIKLADITQEQVDELRNKRVELMNIANSTFKSKGKAIHLLDKGECAVLALSLLLNNAPIVIDERTTRIICENPENLRKLLQKKFHSSIQANKENYSLFKGFKIIRSVELAYIAIKKKLPELKDSKTLEAMLYGLKYRGCSVSEEEIQEVKRL